jgi:hypothetical protein
MLYAKVVLWIKQEETTSDSRVILYRGDKNVDIEFTLKSVDYILSESVEAQLVLVRPYAKSVFSKLHKINQNKVRITITGDMIDELNEMESYAIQIRLFGPNTTARATLPPCYDVIYVREPIAVEQTDDEALVNLAKVNYALTGRNSERIGDIFTDGVYNKTIWYDGDLITDGRLNKVEDALYSISRTDIEQKELIDTHTHDEYLTEHQDISHLATKDEIPSIEGLATKEEIPSIEGLATEDYVDEKISQIEPGGGGMTEEEREQLEKNTSDISTILGIVDTPPTYTKPTLAISFNTSTLEHNKATSVTITPNFKQNDAGSVSKYVLYKNGTEIFNNTTVSAYTDSATISHNGSASYSATATYGDGPIKNTLLGIPYPNTSIKAGSVSASGTIRAYALSYYGVISSSTISENDISSLSSRLSSSKSYTYTVSLSEQRIVYMYPQSFGTLTSIKDANNFDYINSYTRSTLSYNGVDYYVYILTDPVTITGFKQIFN